MTIEEFKTPFEIRLNKDNRWVKLGESMPWDALARIYYRSMSSHMGAPALDARIVIGAMIIKHKMKLDDRETIEAIRENMYMQYFPGLSEYKFEDVFDRSLFTTLRYRLGAEKFDAMTRQIILRSEKQYDEAEEDLDDQDNDEEMNMLDTDIKESDLEENEERSKATTRKPKKNKPRTYRRIARKEYLNLAKKKNKSKKEIRKGIGKQLRYLSRNLKSIEKLLDSTADVSFPLEHRDHRIYWVIQHIYSQQAQMYTERTHSIENRIVNIYQPYVRPIVRGKDKAQVEFGTKLGCI